MEEEDGDEGHDEIHDSLGSQDMLVLHWYYVGNTVGITFIAYQSNAQT